MCYKTLLNYFLLINHKSIQLQANILNSQDQFFDQ
jgi:hypothetical protein